MPAPLDEVECLDEIGDGAGRRFAHDPKLGRRLALVADEDHALWLPAIFPGGGAGHKVEAVPFKRDQVKEADSPLRSNAPHLVGGCNFSNKNV